MSRLPAGIAAAVDRAGVTLVLGTAAGAAVNGRLALDVDGVRVSYPAARITYAAGDSVLVLEGPAGSYVVANLAAGTAPAIPPAAVEPEYVTGRHGVAPEFTGTYRGGAWLSFTDALHQGDWGGFGIHTGAAFYGDRLVDLAHTAGQPAAATLTVRRLRGGVAAGQVATLWLVSERTRPAGAPSRTLSTPLPSLPVGGSAAVDLPDTWTAQLLAGTAGGLAVHVAGASPYVKLAGRSDAADSMTLAVTYRTTA